MSRRPIRNLLPVLIVLLLGAALASLTGCADLVSDRRIQEEALQRGLFRPVTVLPPPVPFSFKVDSTLLQVNVTMSALDSASQRAKETGKPQEVAGSSTKASTKTNGNTARVNVGQGARLLANPDGSVTCECTVKADSNDVPVQPPPVTVDCPETEPPWWDHWYIGAIGVLLLIGILRYTVWR